MEMAVFKFLLCFLILINFNILNIFALELNRVKIFKKSPINIRKGPGKNYPVSVIIDKKDTAFLELNKVDNWCNIKFYNAFEGWVNCNLISNKKNLTALKENARLFRLYNNKEQIEELEKGDVLIIKYCHRKKCRVSKIDKKISGWLNINDLWF